MTTAQELVAGISKLASLPAVYIRVKCTIDDPQGSLAAVAKVLSTDPAMTARILQVVNSPFFGFPGRIETVSRALNILGMQKLHDALLAWAISSACADIGSSLIPMKAYWRKSVARGLAARQLAQHARFVDSERLFVEGLLSDIGHLVMYAQIPELAIQAMDISSRTGRPLHEIERETIGCDYAEVGGVLVSAWGLPRPFNEPISCQINPSAATTHRLEAAILHVAGALAESSGEPGRCRPDPSALAMLDVDDAVMSEARAQVELDLDSVIATLFPRLAAA
jgi:HD-like signal output (HDOD) protein